MQYIFFFNDVRVFEPLIFDEQFILELHPVLGSKSLEEEFKFYWTSKSTKNIE